MSKVSEKLGNLAGFTGRTGRKVQLSEYTTLGVGGPAPLFLEPASVEDVSLALGAFTEMFIMGAGSNLLIGDGGIQVPVIRICDCLDGVTFTGDRLAAGAGAKLPAVARAASGSGLSGLEWAAGIPGTVGGALAVNAGAFGSEIWDAVVRVDVVLAGGEKAKVDGRDVATGYRRAEFGLEGPFVITGAELELAAGEKERIEELTREYGTKRRATQPVSERSAGSFFKNPPEGPPAGKLIDEAGLKGARCGGARVSDVHANFIVNRGGATADEVYTLAEFVRQTVKARTGSELEYEIKLVGELNYLGDDAVES